MPGQVDLRVVEILGEVPPVAHLFLGVVEVLHGTVGTIPTQEAGVHATVSEVLYEHSNDFHVQLGVSEVLWEDLTFELEVDALVVEVLHGAVGTIPTQEAAVHTGLVVEILAEVPPVAHQTLSAAELLVTYDLAVAAVSDISGPSATPAEFDGTTSLGWVTSYWWDWVSVPGGSAIANTIQPFPDSGALTPVDMTDNEVLYHAEEPSGAVGTDTSGNGNSATLNTVTVAAVGHVGSRAWELTGSTSWIEPTVNVVVGSSWTIAFWFFNLAANSAWRTAIRGTSGNTHIVVESGSDRLGTFVSGAFRDSGFSMPAASFTGWNHLVAVGTIGGNTKFYVNGTFAGTVLGFRGTEDIDSIGNRQTNNERFSDRMDEIAIWSRELFPDEIREIYVLQSGNFAGVGPTFGFTPDVDGVYTVNLTAVSGLDGSLSVDTATATIGAAGGGPGLQGEAFFDRPFQSQNFRGRGRFKG